MSIAWRGFVCVSAIACAVVDFVPGAEGASTSPDGFWRTLDTIPQSVATGRQWVEPTRYQACSLDLSMLLNSLRVVPAESVRAAADHVMVLNLPMPDGSFARFEVIESPIMEAPLAARFPEIRTGSGQGLDDPAATLRFDVTPAGFHAQILSPRGAVYIDPLFQDHTGVYASYYSQDCGKTDGGFRCFTAGSVDVAQLEAPAAAGATLDTQLRTYRLACAATGEYTAFHGGTVAAGQAAIVTAINRVNGIYERELAIRFILIASNDSLVYIDGTTDPYTNDNCTTMLRENRVHIDNVIGSDNYDIGHVFGTGSGGIAYLGAACISGYKAGGVTGLAAPVGDAFYVDYVAHEIGHQFNANHTFNGAGGSCSGGNRNAGTAYEPGSGSTIMSYAGLCGANNDLQLHSDPYFHFISLQEIRDYITAGSGSSCAVLSDTGNRAPAVSAGANHTVPQNTPFTLAASGSDLDGNAITYSWEERDLGAARPATGNGSGDNGFSPILRSWIPTLEPWRTFPLLSDLLNGTTTIGEFLPITNRILRFRVTARDNRSGGGGVGFADNQLTITTSAGPFRVTAPDTPVTWQGVQTVIWNEANTATAPVNCSKVNILLSTDGGLTYPVILAAGAPNDGAQVVSLPNISTISARIKVEAVGNVFFDVSDTNFTIVPIQNVSFIASDTRVDEEMESGEHSIRLTLGIANVGTLTATDVSATLTSLTPAVSVLTGTGLYANLPPGAAGDNIAPFVVAVSEAQICRTPILLRLTVTSAQGSNDVDFTFTSGGPAPPICVSYTGPAVEIPNVVAMVEIALVVTGVGTIRDVDFRFDGSDCSTDAASTTVGLNHDWVGDLDAILISPLGTQVRLMRKAGGGTYGSSGHNFCQTLFDDDGTYPSIQTISPAGAPYTGTWLPMHALSAFDGENADGTWTLRVQDSASGDTGSVRAFSLLFAPPVACMPSLVERLPGDFDVDGDVDGLDTQQLMTWATGPSAPYPNRDAAYADFDTDGDVDQDDFGILQRCYSGEGNRADPNCMN